jgi:RHS repeat-associated protein
MAVYRKTATDTLHQSEVHVYGSSRLGIVGRRTVADSAVTLSGGFGKGVRSIFTRGEKVFEISNHLGNVLTTVSDRKVSFDQNTDGTIDFFRADIISAQDYYAFGMIMPGRKISAGGSYRYGFNGKEEDDDVKGDGNQQDYGMRIYDPCLGRFLSVDPITKEYPDLTPYQFASNTPIWAIDLDGLEGLVATGMPMGNSGHGHGLIISVPDARKVNNAVANWFSSKHQQGMRNYRIAEQARQMAIKQGRTDGDGITWWTKSMVYIAPWWNSTAKFSDANDGAVLMQGKNLDGSNATVGDYSAASVGLFIPFVSGSSIKNMFKGFSTAIEGYKYGGKTFKNAEQFEKALVKAGTYEDKVGMVQGVLRDVAKSNNWKKAGDLSKKTGNEFYDLGDGTFGSIDKLHGHFEIFKKEGKTLSHQGSINIDGVKNKERNKAYDIKL